MPQNLDWCPPKWDDRPLRRALGFGSQLVRMSKGFSDAVKMARQCPLGNLSPKLETLGGKMGTRMPNSGRKYRDFFAQKFGRQKTSWEKLRRCVFRRLLRTWTRIWKNCSQIMAWSQDIPKIQVFQTLAVRYCSIICTRCALLSLAEYPCFARWRGFYTGIFAVHHDHTYLLICPEAVKKQTLSESPNNHHQRKSMKKKAWTYLLVRVAASRLLPAV